MSLVDLCVSLAATDIRNNLIDYRNRTIVTYAVFMEVVMSETVQQAGQSQGEARMRKGAVLKNRALAAPKPSAKAGVNPGLIFINRKNIQTVEGGR